MIKPKTPLLVPILLFVLLTSFIARKKNRFYFKNGSYKNYYIEDGVPAYSGITDIILKDKGIYETSYPDTDSTCFNTKEFYRTEIDHQSNFIKLYISESWTSEDCKNQLPLELNQRNFVQYYKIIYQQKDSVVTELRKEVFRTDRFIEEFEEGESGYTIWVYHDKLSKTQKQLLRK